MGITAILMAIEMLLTGLNIASRERDHSHRYRQQSRLGHADPDLRWLAVG